MLSCFNWVVKDGNVKKVGRMKEERLRGHTIFEVIRMILNVSLILLSSWEEISDLELSLSPQMMFMIGHLPMICLSLA